MTTALDRITVRDLLVRGIVGVNPDERTNRQDILINFSMGADTRPAARSDDINATVNYSAVTKAVVKHVETSQPLLVERLAAELVDLIFNLDQRVQAVEMRVEKPTALRFARAVGVTIYRERGQT
jgi:FolB domain-containing protein